MKKDTNSVENIINFLFNYYMNDPEQILIYMPSVKITTGRAGKGSHSGHDGPLRHKNL